MMHLRVGRDRREGARTPRPGDRCRSLSDFSPCDLGSLCVLIYIFITYSLRCGCDVGCGVGKSCDVALSHIASNIARQVADVSSGNSTHIAHIARSQG